MGRVVPHRDDITLVPEDADDLSTRFGKENFGLAVHRALENIKNSTRDPQIATLSVAVLMAADLLERAELVSVRECLDIAEAGMQLLLRARNNTKH